MSWIRTLLLVLLLASAVLFYHSKVKKFPTSSPQGPAVSFRNESNASYILNLKNGESIRMLRLIQTNPPGEILLERIENGSWQVRRPVEDEAEGVIIDGFASLIRLTPRMRELSFEGLDPAEFGFEKPRFQICAETTQESGQRCLSIGAPAVVGDGFYAKWNGEAKLFVVDRQFLEVFDKSLYMLRKKQIFHFAVPIESVEFRSPGRKFQIRRDGKNWFLDVPRQSVLGSKTAEDLMSQLNGLFVKEFCDQEYCRNSQTGLTPPERLIQIRFQDGSIQSLSVGREAPGREAYYSRLSGRPSIFLISSAKFNRIERMFSELAG